jgi:hypothetical protein
LSRVFLVFSLQYHVNIHTYRLKKASVTRELIDKRLPCAFTNTLHHHIYTHTYINNCSVSGVSMKLTIPIRLSTVTYTACCVLALFTFLEVVSSLQTTVNFTVLYYDTSQKIVNTVSTTNLAKTMLI